MSNKDNKKKSTKLKPASSWIDEFSSSDGESTSKMASTSNMLSKYNNVNTETNKRRKCDGAVSKKDNKKKSAKPKPASSQTYEFSSLNGEYIVTEESKNGKYIDSNEEYQYGDTDYLEIVAHYKKPFLRFLKINHFPTDGFM